jgi:ATP-dependent Clp protease ATP-binding subunit ClpA
VNRLLALAREEAVRLGQAEVEPHNLFVAGLREERSSFVRTLFDAGVDTARLRRLIEHRLVPAPATPSEHELPLSTDASEVLNAAKREAETRGDEVVSVPLLLYALVSETGQVADILKAAGGSPERVRARVAESI